MFVSDKYKLIFIHNPKSGGTSITTYLKDIHGYRGMERSDPEPIIHHMSIKEYLKNNPDKENYFKFSVVRNPWSRLVSGFQDFKMNLNGASRPKYHLNMNDYPVEDWRNFPFYGEYEPGCAPYIRGCEPLPQPVSGFGELSTESFRKFCRDLPNSEWKNDVHFLPQLTFLSDDVGNILVDKIFKLETLNYDIEHCDKLPMFDSFVNSTKGLGYTRHSVKLYNESYTELYDDETKDIVYNLFKNDIETLGYEYGK
jgi:hypothetical protein